MMTPKYHLHLGSSEYSGVLRDRDAFSREEDAVGQGLLFPGLSFLPTYAADLIVHACNYHAFQKDLMGALSLAAPPSKIVLQGHLYSLTVRGTYTV
eukprot:1145425-Pelagomonas_calceolata.AAC.2